VTVWVGGIDGRRVYEERCSEEDAGVSGKKSREFENWELEKKRNW
jgi:hypothetical protein